MSSFHNFLPVACPSSLLTKGLYSSTLQLERYSPLKFSPSAPIAACVKVLDPCSAVLASNAIMRVKVQDLLSLDNSVLHRPGFTLTLAFSLVKAGTRRGEVPRKTDFLVFWMGRGFEMISKFACEKG